MDNEEDPISLLELDEAEKEVLEAIDMDLDEDADEDFEKVEELTLPWVSEWIYAHDGLPIHGLEVPIIKDDDFITDEMYCKNIDFGPEKEPPPHVFDPPPPRPADVCSICLKHFTLHHHFCSLPCGHIFGFTCLREWLQPNLCATCPRCKVLSSLLDVRTLYASPLNDTLSDKGVVDQEVSTKRFPFTTQGKLEYRKFEIGRRNFALKKRSDAKKRLAGVLRRKHDLMERRSDLLDRRASMLNRANALELRGGSLCRADALRLRADALCRWVDEYLRRAEACEGRAKALCERVRAYNQRVEAHDVRLQYYYQSCDDDDEKNVQAATCHKD